jgi:hypothetical protein
MSPVKVAVVYLQAFDHQTGAPLTVRTTPAAAGMDAAAPAAGAAAAAADPQESTTVFVIRARGAAVFGLVAPADGEDGEWKVDPDHCICRPHDIYFADRQRAEKFAAKLQEQEGAGADPSGGSASAAAGRRQAAAAAQCILAAP